MGHKKEIIVKFDIEDRDYIEKLKGFYPVCDYPIIKNIHPREWGRIEIPGAFICFQAKE